MAHTFESPSVTRAPRRLQRNAAWAFIVAALASLLLYGGLDGFLWTWIFGAIGIIALAAMRFSPTLVPRWLPNHAMNVSLEPGRVVLRHGSSERTLNATDVAQGWVLPLHAAWEQDVVLVEKRGDVHRIRVPDELTGARVLDALSVGPEQNVVTTRLAPLSRNAVLSALVLVVALLVAPLLAIVTLSAFAGGTVVSLALLFALFAIVLLIVEATTPPMLVVGLDGIRMRSVLRRRFVPWSNVRRLDATPLGVELLLADGRSWFLPAFGDGTNTNDQANVMLRSILERARSTSLSRRAVSAQSEILDQNGRPLETWRRDLTTVMDGGQGYRAQTLDEATLVAVVQDPTAPLDRRLGAALALMRVEQEGPREAVRLAARVSVDDEVRDALEAAAEGELDDERLARLASRTRKG